MRLINVKSRLLEDYLGQTTPKYAILSHRWGSEEVSLQEYQSPGHFEACAGYAKIDAACVQALKTGIDFL